MDPTELDAAALSAALAVGGGRGGRGDGGDARPDRAGQSGGQRHRLAQAARGADGRGAGGGARAAAGLAARDAVRGQGPGGDRGDPHRPGARRIFADHVPAADDLLAARLRAAGAILIGKTNVPEFGLGSHSYNPVHRGDPQPLRPHALGGRVERRGGGGAGGAAGGGGGRLGLHGVAAEPGRLLQRLRLPPELRAGAVGPEGDAYLQPLRDRRADGAHAAGPGAAARHAGGAGPARPAIACRRILHSPAGSRRRSRGRRIGWIGDWGGHYRWRTASSRSARRRSAASAPRRRGRAGRAGLRPGAALGGLAGAARLRHGGAARGAGGRSGEARSC